MLTQEQEKEALELLKTLEPEQIGEWRLPGWHGPKITYQVKLHRDAYRVPEQPPRVTPDIDGDLSNRTFRTELIDAKDVGGELEFHFDELLELVSEDEQIWRSILRRDEPNPQVRLRPQGAVIARLNIRALQESCKEEMAK